MALKLEYEFVFTISASGEVGAATWTRFHFYIEKELQMISWLISNPKKSSIEASTARSF